MIFNINYEIIIFVYSTFFIFSYVLKYISLWLNNIYKSTTDRFEQYELYESGAPIYYKTDKKMDLQSYLLALFFLIFELELFLTYPFIINSQSQNLFIIFNNYKELNLNDNSAIINYNELVSNLVLTYQNGVAVAIFAFFFTIIFALALEWAFDGLEFISGKFGRNVY
jgi:NADH:ubiquinone oxidoreductase subunit 3 (subunit A)